jgi:hypothetical protein
LSSSEADLKKQQAKFKKAEMARVNKNKRKKEKWQKDERERLNRIDKGTTRTGDDKAAPEPVYDDTVPLEPEARMHPDDADNFLKLATALKIILARTIYIPDLDHAKTLLHEYLVTFLKVFILLFRLAFSFMPHLLLLT